MGSSNLAEYGQYTTGGCNSCTSPTALGDLGMTEKVLPFATRCDGCALVRTEEDAQEKPPEACVTFAAEIEPK